MLKSLDFFSVHNSTQPVQKSLADIESIIHYPVMVAPDVLLAGFNSKFSFETSQSTKGKEPSLPNYLPIARRRRDRFMLFLRNLVESDMQTAF